MQPYLDPKEARLEAELLNLELWPRVRYGDAWYPACFETRPCNHKDRKCYEVSPLLWSAACAVPRDTVVKICKAVSCLGKYGEILLCDSYQVECTGKLSPHRNEGRLQGLADSLGLEGGAS